MTSGSFVGDDDDDTDCLEACNGSEVIVMLVIDGKLRVYFLHSNLTVIFFDRARQRTKRTIYFALGVC